MGGPLYGPPHPAAAGLQIVLPSASEEFDSELTAYEWGQRKMPSSLMLSSTGWNRAEFLLTNCSICQTLCRNISIEFDWGNNISIKFNWDAGMADLCPRERKGHNQKDDLSNQGPYREYSKDRAQAQKALIRLYAKKVVTHTDANGGSYSSF